MHDEPKYWFPAKRYGWGWGFPTTWQGVVVMLAYVALMALGGGWLLPRYGALGGFLLYTGLITAALVGVCWLKGEPPRWRWGDKE